MKHFKLLAAAGGICLALGAVFTGVAISHSDSPIWKYAEFSIGPDSIARLQVGDGMSEMDEAELQTDSSAPATAFGDETTGAVEGETDYSVSPRTIENENERTFSPSGTAEKIDLKIDAGDVSIVRGDTLSVQLLAEKEHDLRKIQVRESFKNKNWNLQISASRISVFGGYFPWQAVVTVPDQLDVRIQSDAGSVSVEDMQCGSLRIECSAGNVEIRSSEIADLQAELDAGSVEIIDTAIGKARFAVDAGSLRAENIHLNGDLNASVDLGEAILSIAGKEEDYSRDLEADLGQIVINGQSVGSEDQYESRAKNPEGKLSICASLGQIDLMFER